MILTADGGHTVVELTHHGLPARHRPTHKKSWDTFLNALPAVLAHH